MPLAPAERAAFLDLIGDLGPEGDRRRIVAFATDHADGLRSELGARPGMDQVRAAALRLGDVLGDVEAGRAEALAAIEAYADDVADPDPAVLLERAPSWVGIAYLEARGDEGWSRDAARTAAELAAKGFAAARLDGIGEGELLWALAEAAGEVGWTDRERFLLDEARQSSFESEERAGEVALIYGMRCLEDGDVEGVAVLEAVAELDAATPRTRVHARAILGGMAVERDDRDEARKWFAAARAEVDADDEPEVAARLDEMLAGL